MVKDVYVVTYDGYDGDEWYRSEIYCLGIFTAKEDAEKAIKGQVFNEEFFKITKVPLNEVFSIISNGKYQDKIYRTDYYLGSCISDPA